MERLSNAYTHFSVEVTVEFFQIPNAIFYFVSIEFR